MTIRPNAIIIGTGKIGIDLYIKCKRSKIFNQIYIFNRNKNSSGAKFCQKNNFLYSSEGIKGILKIVDKCKFIFDATSAKSNIQILQSLENRIYDKYFINLTPSKNGQYVVPYTHKEKIPKMINLITCGGQTSTPIINEFKKILGNNLKYVELVSSIASKSAGKATRDNIDEYITTTEKAIKKLTKTKEVKVIININPSEPPVNMMNSLFFETKKKITASEYAKMKININRINKKIKSYIPQYNATIFKTFENNIIRVTIRVIGQGDYLPKYAGNLDIITSSAVYLSKMIYEKR